jgi:hypothetical protein
MMVLFPLNLILLRAYAAEEEMVTARITVKVVTMIEFKKYRERGKLFHTEI